MLSLRPETAGDFAAVEVVLRLAFGQPNEARLVQALRATDAYIPALSLVAVVGGEVVGHVLFTRIAIRTAELQTAALALAPVAVRPEHQRAGVGSALIRHGLDVARRLEHRIVVVLGHATYYPRFGFELARPHAIEAPFPVRDSSWMVCELAPGALRGVHGTVQYAAPFSAV